MAKHGSQRPAIEGLGPVIAGRLLGRISEASRFVSASASVNYVRVAPVDVASALWVPNSSSTAVTCGITRWGRRA